MATTAHHYKMVKALERLAEASGFKVSTKSNGWSNDGLSYLTLVPNDDELPIYTRGTSLVSGSVEELTAFIIGWQKSIEYLTFLRITNTEKIKRKEQDYRNVELARLIKDGKKNDESPF